MIWWLDITYWGLRVKGQGQSDDWSKWPVRLITRQLLCLSNVLKHYRRVMYDPYMNTFELVLSGQWTRSRSALLQKLLGLNYNTRCIYIIVTYIANCLKSVFNYYSESFLLGQPWSTGKYKWQNIRNV